MLKISKPLKFLTMFVLFFLTTLIIDTFVMKGTVYLPGSDLLEISKNESGLPVFDYSYYPFSDYNDVSLDDAGDKNDGWVVSHPMGTGAHEGVFGIKIHGSGKIEDLQIRRLFSFNSGYSYSDDWVSLGGGERNYSVSPPLRSNYIQVRLKNRAANKRSGIKLTVSLQAGDSIGLPGIFWRDMEVDHEITRGEFDLNKLRKGIAGKMVHERPVRSLFINSSYKAYKTVQILNGTGANVLGVLEMENDKMDQLMESVRIFGSVVKLWKITGSEKHDRETVQRLISTIYLEAPGSVILWDDNDGIFSGARTASGDGLPVDLNRGTLWTAIILFTLLFLAHGTRRMFGFRLRFSMNELNENRAAIMIAGAVLAAPLLAEGVLFTSLIILIRNLLFTMIIVYILEFLRAVLIVSLRKIWKYAFNKDFKEEIFWPGIIFASALLSLLYFGYPGFSSLGSWILIISNFVCGLYFGLLLEKGRPLGLVYMIHLISLMPAMALLGK